jgi:hypothetical protein
MLLAADNVRDLQVGTVGRSLSGDKSACRRCATARSPRYRHRPWTGPVDGIDELYGAGAIVRHAKRRANGSRAAARRITFGWCGRDNEDSYCEDRHGVANSFRDPAIQTRSDSSPDP